MAANRQGNLTPKQEQLVESILQTRQRDARRTAIWLIAFYTVLMIIGIATEYSNQGENLASFFQKQGMIFLFITLFLLAIIAISFFFTAWIERDAHARRIRTTEGEARVLVQAGRTRGGSRYMRYELRIKRGTTSKLFRFGNAESIKFFEHGHTYRVYYIDYYPFQIALSAEKL